MNTATRKITSRLASLAVGIAATVGAVGLQATPAAAATQTTACFVWSTGAAYSLKPVYLNYWNGSGWVNIRSGTTNASGCGTFRNVPANVYVNMQGYVALNNGTSITLWNGYTGWAAPGQGAANLGTAVVSRI
jgi:hypothetical protein